MTASQDDPWPTRWQPRARNTLAAATFLFIAIIVLPSAVADAHSREGRKRWREPAPAQIVNLTDGLVAYWKLDEAAGTRFDSASGNDLTESITLDTGVGSEPGVVGNQAVFDGEHTNGSHLYASQDSALTFGNTAWTVAFWYSGGSGNIAVYPLRKGPVYGSIAEAEFYIWMREGGARQVRVGVGDGASTVGEIVWRAPSLPWFQGPHLIIAWYDGASLWLQIDQDAPLSVTPTSAPAVTSHPLTIGLDMGNGDETHAIDELGKWNRVLTADERAALYNGGAGTTLP